jgi:hypothetical protein
MAADRPPATITNTVTMIPEIKLRISVPHAYETSRTIKSEQLGKQIVTKTRAGGALPGPHR